MRMACIVHSGGTPALLSIFCAVRSVFLPLKGVLGVALAETGAEVRSLRGVCGSRGVEESGRALAR